MFVQGQLIAPAFRRIDAAAAVEIMLEMKPAALQVPASGLARPSGFSEPQMDHRFLQQVLAQRNIGSQAPDHVRQRFPERGVFGGQTQREGSISGTHNVVLAVIPSGRAR